MEPSAEGGSDEIENAIPVCFECHAEIHSYNDQHPRGRKFTAGELRAHKAEWLRICKEKPEALLSAARNVEVGPLQALIDELEFNAAIVQAESDGDMGCLFQLDQFLRAIEYGSISILKDEVRTLIIDAYRTMGSANTKIQAMWTQSPGKGASEAHTAGRRAIGLASQRIKAARDCLLQFLGTEGSR